MILCDTNILIEFYNGNTSVKDVLQDIGAPNIAVSIVTVGELLYGAKDKRELHKIQKHLGLIHQIPIDADISKRFLSLLEEYALSHRLSLPDALIAATSISHGISLYTLNIKDFRYIPNLQLYNP